MRRPITILAASFFLSRPEVAVTDPVGSEPRESPGREWRRWDSWTNSSWNQEAQCWSTSPGITRARQTFEEAVGRVQPAVEGVITQLRSLSQVPDEVHVEFGLDLNAEVGAFVAAVSTTANFTVALTWRRDPASEQPQPGSNVSATGGHGTS